MRHEYLYAVKCVCIKHMMVFTPFFLRIVLALFSPFTSLRDLLLLQCPYFSSLNSTDVKNLNILYSKPGLFF